MKNVIMTAIGIAFIPGGINSSEVLAMTPDQAIEQLIQDDGTLKELKDAIGNGALNCATPNRWPEAYQEFVKMMRGLGRVFLEQAQVLAYKKDYPTVCHVLTKNQLASYSEGTLSNSKSQCDFGVCTRVTTSRPKPTYYWPKYFVEVTEKGTDSHPSFSESNLLYTANRKIASSLGKAFDVKGASSLAKTLLGMSALTGTLDSIGVKTKGYDSTQLMKAGILEPLEALRVRANGEKTQATYEANIWPVALSEATGLNLSVCGGEYERANKEIGYSWPFKGVPMTCPVSMSRDAYAFWDTGLVDYLDPQAVASMALAANPVSCGTAQAASTLGGQGYGKSNAKGEQGGIDKAAGGLTATLSKAIRPCSWPLMGAAEAIAQKAVSATDATKWAGPYCTVWGALAPRASSSVYQNDYSYANAALKWKLLSHELFGVPRGAKERWSLAYPWEGPGARAIPGSDLTKGMNFDAIGKLVNLDSGGDGKLKEAMDKVGMSGGSSGTSRSEALLLPGDPRLIDTSVQTLGDTIKNLAKEAAYLSVLTAGSVQAGKAAREAYEKQFGEKAPDPEQILSDLDKTTSAAEAETALLDQEAIYEFEDYCHVAGEKSGTVYGNSANRFSVNYPGRVQGGPFDFGPGKADFCFAQEFGGCIKRDSTTGRCKNKRDGQQVYYRKAILKGYRQVQNPKIFKLDRGQCSVSSFSTPNTQGDKVSCEDRLTVIGVKDTREPVQRPDPKNPKTITANPETAAAIQAAATAATWVGAEAARLKYAEITGKNHISGGRRVYTVWESVECVYPSTKIEVSGSVGSFAYYESCQAGIKLEIYKFIQTKLLRKICDMTGETVGKPWK